MTARTSNNCRDSGHAIFERLKQRHALDADGAAETGTARGEATQGAASGPPASPRAPPAADPVRPQDPRAQRRGVTGPPSAPDWLPDAQLEHAAPKAVALLTRVWGTAGGAKALRALVLDGDGLVRRWPRAVWPELVLLCQVHAAAYPAPPGTDAVSTVPDVSRLSLIETGYRHAVERLVAGWGSVEAFAVVCHDLLFDHRGDRTGWPAEVWEDLVLLQRIHDRVHGRLPPGVQPWKSFFLDQR
jgi:hypothetical protein